MCACEGSGRLHTARNRCGSGTCVKPLSTASQHSVASALLGTTDIAWGACRVLFEAGTRLGDVDAVFNLALMHMYGLHDVPVNTTRAFELLLIADEGAQWEAPLLLAELYQEHPAVPGGQDCSKALQHLWVFVVERGDFSELSMDALEMATGVPQVGGSAMARPAEDGGPLPPMPRDPRRALLLYVMMAEQGCLTATMNAAWVLEHSAVHGLGSGRGDLVQYLYLRAVLADYPVAAVDYANWLLRQPDRGSLGKRGAASAQRVEGRGAARMESSGSAPGLAGGLDAWALLLRLGLVDGGPSGGEPGSTAEQARLLYTHAEKLRDPEAATNLGWMYMAGVGAQRNLTMAQERYQAALALAGSEAERLAPRVALVCVRGWMVVDRLLPAALAELAYAAVGHSLRCAALVFWVLAEQLQAAASAVRAWLSWPPAGHGLL